MRAPAHPEQGALSGLLGRGRWWHGESYAEAAARELHEELGIAGVPLREHGRFFFEDPGNRLWGTVYSAVSDARLVLQPEEVLEARFMSPQQALAHSRHESYCPDSLEALRLFLR